MEVLWRIGLGSLPQLYPATVGDIVMFINKSHAQILVKYPQPVMELNLALYKIDYYFLQESAAALMHAFVTSRVDYCNAVFRGDEDG